MSCQDIFYWNLKNNDYVVCVLPHINLMCELDVTKGENQIIETIEFLPIVLK